MRRYWIMGMDIESMDDFNMFTEMDLGWTSSGARGSNMNWTIGEDDALFLYALNIGTSVSGSGHSLHGFMKFHGAWLDD